MKQFLLSSLCLLGMGALYGQQSTEPTASFSAGEARLIGKSESVRNLKPKEAMNAVKVRDELGVLWTPGKKPRSPEVPITSAEIKEDGALQPPTLGPQLLAQLASVGANFNGMGFTSVNPPDPSLAVGPNHVIQMINGGSGAYFRIYDKTGTALNAQTYLDNLTSRGGLGDPIVLYDQLADRFVMTEFANASETGSEGLVVAVSQTPDPLGSWYIYYFSTGTNFPDYPKFSVWPDAYYATSNDFGASGSYNGSSIYAFDRVKMLAGQPLTTFQSVKFNATTFTKYFTMCPVLLQGNTTPPAGTGGLVAYMFDGDFTATTADADSIGLLEYKINWSTPALSTLVQRYSARTIDYKSQICTASRGACIPQPGTTSRLEALQQKIMNQPIYRNFGGREGIVLTHVLDKGSNISGIRWYELEKTTGNWGILQQSTYSPDNVHRWMPSIAYDAQGNIGLAYNVSDGSSVSPGVRFTGRRSCDPLNTMTVAETVIVNGASRNGSTRYGDYNHLVGDPSGTGFWFTAEWNNTTSWSTRVASFTIENCGAVACDAPASLTSSNITSTGATLNWGAVSGAQNYTVEYKAASSTTWITAASAATGTSVALTGLLANTVYDWRVRTNCSGGASGFVAAQFTTLVEVVVCNAPTGLSSSAVTASAATLSWTAAANAQSYTVEYKTTSATTWTTAASATTATSVSISGLVASTTYDWRVRTNCTGGNSSFSAAQFTTLAIVCTDPYEANNSRSAAASIAVNTDIRAIISSSTDNDYFKFNNSSATPNIRVTLSNLTRDYDLELFRNGRTQRLARSQNDGTAAETITLNTSNVAQYEVRVYPFQGANDPANCYTLRVALSGSRFSADASLATDNNLAKLEGGLQAYPNPAKGTLNIAFDADEPGKATISLRDAQGRLSGTKVVGTQRGTNITKWDVSRISGGIYILSVEQQGKMLTKKVVISQ